MARRRRTWHQGTPNLRAISGTSKSDANMTEKIHAPRFSAGVHGQDA